MTLEEIQQTKQRMREIARELREIGEKWRSYTPSDTFEYRYAGAAWRSCEIAGDAVRSAVIYAPGPDLPDEPSTPC